MVLLGTKKGSPMGTAEEPFWRKNILRVYSIVGAQYDPAAQRTQTGDQPTGLLGGEEV